jgi:hypothetical protein
MRRIALLALLLPGACAGYPQPPAQPTPASIQDAYVQLSVITADPVTAWLTGDYAVRTACYAYLNGMAQRSADLSLESGALGMGGGAAAIASGHPYVAAATALGESFLTLFQQSGAIPYTTETSMLIEGGLDAVETGVALQPPKSAAQALLDVQKLWWQCSAGGYRQLVSQSIVAGARSVRAAPSVTGVPRLTMDVVTAPPTPTPTPQTEPRSRARTKLRVSAPAVPIPSPSLYDPDKPARLQWLRETSTYIRALDGPR